jgi:hypothetical protein
MIDMRGTEHAPEVWPSLPLAEWRETLDTLHMWTQIVGKVKLELTPFLNEWWNVALYVTPRGLTTGSIPGGTGIFEIDFDFIDHNLFIRTSRGSIKAMSLIPRSVAAFYAEIMAMISALGIDVTIDPLPVEVPNPVRCDLNETDASYDPEYAERWWRILVQTEMVLQRFRSRFVGKSSPVNFFWGSFDLAHTRFSGRPATPPAGGPHFMQLAEDQENYACGIWPGNATASGLEFGEPAFYAYIYPDPAGFKEATVRPAAAYFDSQFGLFILPYDAVRQSADPAEALLDFLQSTYEAAATYANWDRDALESIP